MYHTFIHSSINRHLGCFHVLAIVNSAAVNIRVHISFQTMAFSRYIPRNGISGLYGNCILKIQFLKNIHTVLHSGFYRFTFPPTMLEGPLLSIPFPAFIVCRLFDDGHSDQCEVIPHCSFHLHFYDN